MRLHRLISLSFAVALSQLAATEAKAQASFGVLRDTAPEVAGDLAEEIDRALIEELKKTASVQDPIVAPTDYSEIQLTLGCEGETTECLRATATTIQVKNLVLRVLRKTSDGGLVLRLLLFSPGVENVPIPAEATADEASAATLVGEVPRLVRAIFGIAEPAEAHTVSPAAAPSAQPEATATAPRIIETEPQATEHHAPARIGALTWIVLASGVAVIGTGIALGVSAQSDFDTYKSTRVEKQTDVKELKERLEDVQLRGTLSNVLTPLGGGLLGLGAVLLVLDLSSSGEERAGTSLRFSPSFAGASLTWTGSWSEPQ